MHVRARLPAAACAQLGLARLDAAAVEELMALARTVSSAQPAMGDRPMDEPGMRLLVALQVAAFFPRPRPDCGRRKHRV